MKINNFRQRLKNAINAFLSDQKSEPISEPIIINKHQSNPLFISYSHMNEGLINQLASYLEQEEIPPWVDNQLKLGDSWDNIIVKRIKECSVFLLCMSSESDKSEYVHKELKLAQEFKKTIIPILLDEILFNEVKDINFIRFLDTIHTRSNFVEQLRDLVAPSMVPSINLQQRRVNEYCLGIFSVIEGVQGSGVHIGFGLDYDFGITLTHPLKGLDELDWAEVFANIKKKLPHKNFFNIKNDYSSLFPTIGDFAIFLKKNLNWEDIRKLSGK